MKRKRYIPEQKARIVLLGLRSPGKIGEVCREYGVHPVTFSQWKRAFLGGGLEAFRRGGKTFGEGVQRENRKLKELVGSLYVEFDFSKTRVEAGR